MSGDGLKRGWIWGHIASTLIPLKRIVTIASTLVSGPVARADADDESAHTMSFFGSWGRSPRTTAQTHRAETVRTLPTPTGESGWDCLREQPRPQDLVLSALAQKWCHSLQERQRPVQLCALFPRIANRLALCWDDPALVSKVLDELVVDRRRNRAGFPPAVSQELVNLRLLRPSSAGFSGFTPLWDSTSMASSDR